MGRIKIELPNESFYVEIEDYTKCQHIKDLMDMLERPNENSNKKTKPSV